MKFLITFLYIFLLIIGAARATESPKFLLPLACTPEKDCWVVKYIDVDPAAGSEQDFTCHTKTSDDHKGVDFAIRSRREMRDGVDVVAAMAGKVTRLRDGESDSIKTEEEFQAVRDAKHECGNAVLIDHGGGLNTLYCHMKEGSIVVKVDDEVAAGQKIGQVGQSGFAEFPHLHFGIIQGNDVLDPFTGEPSNAGCGLFKQSLWKDDLLYEPVTIFHGGFDVNVPDFAAIRDGLANPDMLPGTAQNLIYWAGFYQAVAGDTIDMKIIMPDGQVFVQRHITVAQNRKRPSFYYTGRKLNGHRLPPGTYTGETTYTKPGFPPKTVTHSIIVR